jgi:hypothetical protein
VLFNMISLLPQFYLLQICCILLAKTSALQYSCESSSILITLFSLGSVSAVDPCVQFIVRGKVQGF